MDYISEKEHDDIIDSLADYFEGVVNYIYQTNDVSEETLYHCLEEMAHLLKVPIPDCPPSEHKK